MLAGDPRRLAKFLRLGKSRKIDKTSPLILEYNIHINILLLLFYRTISFYFLIFSINLTRVSNEEKKLKKVNLIMEQ